MNGLLDRLFSNEAIESGQAHSLSLSEAPGKERDEETLEAIEQLKIALATGNNEIASVALENLLDVQGGKPMRIILSQLHKAARDPASHFKPTDIDDAKQVVMLKLLKHINTFDPEKDNFEAWLTKWASSAVLEMLKKQGYFRTTGKQVGMGGGGDDGEKGSDDWERHIRSRDGGSQVAFTDDEEKLGKAISAYLKEIRDGKQPFPYVVKVPSITPPEERPAVKHQIQSRALDIFMSHFGIGAPRLSSVEIAQKYKDKKGEPVSKFQQRELMAPMKKAVLNWVERHGHALGLEASDPVIVYHQFMAKLADMIGRKPGTAPIIEQFEDCLFGLLDALEGWHASSND